MLYMYILHTNTCEDAFSHKLHSQITNSFHITVPQPEEQLTGKLPLQAETIDAITMQKFAYGECCTYRSPSSVLVYLQIQEYEKLVKKPCSTFPPATMPQTFRCTPIKSYFEIHYSYTGNNVLFQQ